jgi:alpha-galactosidase
LEKKSLEYLAYGSELMEVGITISRDDLSRKGGDFASILFKIDAKS